MSLAKLFYLKETFRERVRRWRRACFQRRVQSSVLRTQNFTLESLEPRVLLSVAVPQGDLASLDVDLNGQADALTDGIVIIRHLFGFTGDDLIRAAVVPGGGRTDPIEIAQYLESIRPSLDVDLNGTADALTDGIVIIRSLFGFTGDDLIRGAIDPGGGRTDPAAIATFLDNMIPQRELIAPLLLRQAFMPRSCLPHTPTDRSHFHIRFTITITRVYAAEGTEFIPRGPYADRRT